MPSTMLAEIAIPVVAAVAIVLWIIAGYRDSRPWRGAEREPAPESDIRVPELRELDESGTDYVDFGAPERARRS